jgi:hypothetical protein
MKPASWNDVAEYVAAASLVGLEIDRDLASICVRLITQPAAPAATRVKAVRRL